MIGFILMLENTKEYKMFISKINNRFQSRNLQSNNDSKSTNLNLKSLKHDTITFGSGQLRHIRIPENSAKFLRAIADCLTKTPDLIGSSTCREYSYQIVQQEMRIIFKSRRECENLRLKLRKDGDKLSGLEVAFTPSPSVERGKIGVVKFADDFSMLEMEEQIPSDKSTAFYNSIKALEDVTLP